MKKVFGLLAFLSFFLVIGTMGAVEQYIIPLKVGTIRMGIGLFLFCLFCLLSGAFKPCVSGKRKPPLGVVDRKGGKRKSSF